VIRAAQKGVEARPRTESTDNGAAASRNIEIYGSLKEGVHIAGYTLERAWGHLEWLLEEDRWRAVGFEDVNVFLDSVKLDSFRMLAEQRKRIAQRIKELQPEASNRTIAKMLGAGSRTIDRDTAPNGADETVKDQDNQRATAPNGAPTSLGGAEAARLIGRAEAKLDAAKATEERRAASRNAQPLSDGMELRIGDCRTVLADVPDHSVPLILTDPPYGDEAEPLYRWLADFAARVLIPGGSLICYTGHSRLNRDHAIFSAKLRYWWELCMPHEQSHQRLPGKFVIVGWRPILWYVRDHRRGRSLVPDVLKSTADKSQHRWAQGTGGVEFIIENLTEPGELIVDPFAGTGTWGRITVSMGRRWVGCDIIEGGAATVKSDPLEAEEVSPPATSEVPDLPDFLRRAPPETRP
jgi:hypothetical protein